MNHAAKTWGRVLPGLISWVFLLCLILSATFAPIFGLGWIFVFELYWCIFLMYHLLLFVGFRIARWRYSKQLLRRPVSDSGTEKSSDWLHVLLIPISKDAAEAVEETFQSCLAQTVDSKNILLLFALDDHASEKTKRKVWELHRGYSDELKACYIAPFLADNPEAALGSGANLNFAAKMADQVLDQKNLNKSKCLVTCIHPGFVLDPDYLTLLLQQVERYPGSQACLYRGITEFSHRLWDCSPAVVLLQLSTALFATMQTTSSSKVGGVQAYSLPFSYLKEIGFWPVGTPVEGPGIYWQAMRKCRNPVKIRTLYCTQPMPPPGGMPHADLLRAAFILNEGFANGLEEYSVISHKSPPGDTSVPFIQKAFFLIRQSSIAGWAPVLFLIGWLPYVVSQLAGSDYFLFYQMPRYVCMIGWLALVQLLLVFLLTLSHALAFYRKTRFIHLLKFILFLGPLMLLIPVVSSLSVLSVQTRNMLTRA